MSRSEAYLRHILDAIEKIERYAAVGHQEFMAGSHWQDAVIRQLEIISEAVKRLAPEDKVQRPEIPWRAVAGLRDVLIHNYSRPGGGLAGDSGSFASPAAGGRGDAGLRGADTQ